MNWLKKELLKLEGVDFNPRREWRKLVVPFLAWSLSSFAFVVFVTVAEAKGWRTVGYYNEAVQQAIGPILWNVIGAIALAFFALCLMLPKVKWISEVTHHLTMCVFLMGAMMIGISFSQYFSSLSGLEEYLDDWRAYFYVPIAFILLIMVFMINASVGYLAYLVGWSERFLPAVANVNMFLRIIAGLSLFFITLWQLWIEP